MNATGTLRRRAGLVLAPFFLLACTAITGAHHSTAMFDMQNSVEIKGTIKEFLWTNPHTWTVVTVEGDPATAGEYGLEGMSPNYLGRNGWTKNTLKFGDKVTLQIHPLKDGRKGGFMMTVKFADGRIMHNLPGPASDTAPAR